jgi:hypothetical protein
MIKHQLLIRGERPSDEDELGRRLLALDAARLKLTTTIPAPRLALFPFKRAPLALLSLWSEAGELSRFTEAAREAFPGAGLTAYRVDESTPRAYPRDWPDGLDTPGVVLLTLFRKPLALSREAFLSAWHGHHTPLTLEIHPVWGYIRNVVESAALPGSPELDGIVEEHFRDPRDLLNPLRFYGGPLAMLPNMVRVALDIRRFIELRSIEVFLARERWLRS